MYLLTQRPSTEGGGVGGGANLQQSLHIFVIFTLVHIKGGRKFKKGEKAQAIRCDDNDDQDLKYAE